MEVKEINLIHTFNPMDICNGKNVYMESFSERKNEFSDLNTIEDYLNFYCKLGYELKQIFKAVELHKDTFRIKVLFLKEVI